MIASKTDVFGRQCLLRGLVERGVRFVQLYHTSGGFQPWDQHSDLKGAHARNVLATDLPIAGLLIDLKARGLLDETLVIWGGEFGRTPAAEGADGRDHHPYGFTMWLAGGGVRGGMTFVQPTNSAGRQGSKGRLYVTWSDYREGDIGVYCATSDDGGRTWSKAVRVNSNPPHDGTDQFFQWLAVDPVSGAANVIFYDRRLDPNDRKTAVTLARSTDGGATFANYAWTRDTFVSRRDEFLGDYIGIAALNNKVYGVWAEIAPPETPKDKTAPPPTEFRPHTIVKIGVADFGSAAH